MNRPDLTSGTVPRGGGGRRALALCAIAAAAGAGFGLLAAAVARRDTALLDEAVHEATAPDPEHPVREVARAVAPVGKWYTYLPMALGASAGILAAPGPRGGRAWRARGAGVGAVLLAASAATLLNPRLDDWLPQPPPPPGHRRDKAVFPSGHAFGPGTVALATAYVLSREGLARPAAAFPAALAVPLLAAGGRVLEEKHWASDVVGGLLGAATLASACLAAYEVLRE